MSMTTTPTFQVPKPRLGSWLRQHLTWVLVALALVATAVVATAVVAGDSGTDVVPQTITEPDATARTDSLLDQSITARDHADAAARSDSLLDQSITARDHERSRDARMAGE